MWLEGRVAIVTGAGSGIGRAIANRLAQEGAAVVVAEIDVERGEAVANALANSPGQAAFLRTDVSQLDDLQRMVEFAVERFGGLDILVNNAGVNFVKPLLETTAADWEHVIGVDLRGTFFGCKYAAEHFIRTGRGGCIVNISSVHSVATLPEAGPYAAAKGGVTQLTRSLAIELGAHAIRVNAVCPGLTNTQIWQDLKASAPSAEEITAFWRRSIALRREGEPEEVANMVAWLCSDQASYVTGANLFVDGGMTAMLVPHGS